MTVLSEILDSTKKRVDEAKRILSFDELHKQAVGISEARRGNSFFIALNENPTRPSVIAEFKRRSPSEGLIRDVTDPLQTVEAYVKSGAKAVSILTEPEYFGGSTQDLKAVRKKFPLLPILRKDFTIDRYQIAEAKTLGADAILLILAALSDSEISDFFSYANLLGLESLFECHTEEELIRAKKLGPKLLGWNHRDLSTMKVSLDSSKRFEEETQSAGTIWIAESGIRSSQDVGMLWKRGFRAFLVGTSLMRAAGSGDELKKIMEMKP